MAWLTPILGLEGEWGDIRAVLVVVVAFVVLVGGIYMLLWSNLGARLGYLVMMVSLGIWMIILSLTWLVGLPGTVPGLGPRGPEPQWIPFKTQTDQAAEFQGVLERFPEGWDAPGQLYPGKIDSRGEFDTVKVTVSDALARDAARNQAEATKAEDWDFRAPGSETLPGQEAQPPEARQARFIQADADTLLFGVTIAATDKHPEVTVFALRDKGKVFLYGLYFLIASIAGFAIHLWLLVRYEKKAPQFETAEPTPV